VPRITNHLTFLLDGNLTSLCSCRMFQNLSLTQLAGDAPITSKQAAKLASLNAAGFYDPFSAEKARQGADKMNNIIAMYTR